MKILTNISRVLVGLLFIFSGLVKANDPLGLAYKMQEFFDVWSQSGFMPRLMHSLNDYALPFAIIMISFEIVAGVALLVGWNMKIFSWLLLILILFFSFLTGYAYLSGKFRSCGCFGDCIPLKPSTSFIKDLLLLFLILVIIVFQKYIRPLFFRTASVAVVLFSLVFSLAIQWYVLKHLPISDCLPFKIGNNIAEKMKIPPGAVPDSVVINFVYKKDGKEIEFTADNFPADFDDSIYHFVKRYDKLVRQGNAEAPIKDFNLKTFWGNDTTTQLLESEGYKIFLFLKDVDEVENGWEPLFSQILEVSRQKGIPSFIITASPLEKISKFVAIQNFNEPILLSCDPVPIKTAARANPTLILLKKDTIVGKWSFADFIKAFDEIKDLPRNSNEESGSSTTLN